MLSAALARGIAQPPTHLRTAHQATLPRIPPAIRRGCNTHDVHRTRVRHVAYAGSVVEVNEEQLEAEIANRDRPIVLDCYATWCGPCLLLTKELEQVSSTLGESIKILKLDVDKNEAIASALAIQGLPTLIFVPLDPSKPALRTEGLLPAQTIIEIIENELMGAGTAAANDGA